MNLFKEISPYEISDNPFTMIEKDWMLITTKNKDKVNTMTASWGGVGFLWAKPVATIYVRPQRYTKELLDSTDTFSLNIMAATHRDSLALCGKVSGRDVDKVTECGFTVAHAHNTPFFEQSRLVLICRKLFVQELAVESFIDKDIPPKIYPTNDFHHMYIAEILSVLTPE